ncbi:MAG: PD-(D/E)XK nuclease family protein [Atopobiaceae bacterium]|nr:PD-(D/E)XK nuclease family protein [Atopobiaceae bacterium]
MSLTIVTTTQEGLLTDDLLAALREGIALCDSALLFVPSFAQALDVQRKLADEPGLALAVTVTTPAAWVQERWEVWGDGRTLASPIALTLLARKALLRADKDELGPMQVSPGLTNVLASLVGRALPWLPLDKNAKVQQDICAQAGLTRAETLLVGLAGKVSQLLREHGQVSAAEASAQVVGRMADAGVQLPPVVATGFTTMTRTERELLCALKDQTRVTVLVATCNGPASEQTDQLVRWFQQACQPTVLSRTARHEAARSNELSALVNALFSDATLEASTCSSVDLLLAAGPVAEAELVARRVSQLLASRDVEQVVVSVPNMVRARRELVPKLVARGVGVRLSYRRPLLDTPSAQAFFAFARIVALLAELDANWPLPIEGMDGPVAQLGDMSWWPPRELSDFLLSDIAHVDATRAWWNDAVWRGNRLLTPAQLLAQLQSERDTSRGVAQATAELLRGRMGSAASRLLLPYVEQLSLGELSTDEHADEAREVLQAILALAGTLRELGVTTDTKVKDAVSLGELVEIAAWAAESSGVMRRMDVLPAGAEESAMCPRVRLMTPGETARLAPASVDALVLCGHTTAEQPITAADDLLSALLEQLAIEPASNPMARARAAFRAQVCAARAHLVLERALHDADSKPTYPSVMLSELLAAYGIPASAPYEAITLPKQTLAETSLAQSLSVRGNDAQPSSVCDPEPAGRLSNKARGLVFVPQDGSVFEDNAKPVLSASQIETYLDCPYKWFSLRRLRLGTVDAGHGGMEMGTFAHRVLEVTHRELLAQALEAQVPGVARDELLAQIEVDPARHVPNSRVDASNLQQACAALEHEFELHRQHMYMVRRPRLSQQLLVAHSAAERAQEEQLRQDLLSSLAYQTRILEGFEPRLFEWSFGRHGNLVEYAGAYFTGTVDRIDVSPHGTAVIVDYKHKNPQGFAAEYDALQDGVLEGEQLPNRVQSLIYAQVVRRAFSERLRLVGSVYLSTKSPHALAGVADANVADLVFGRVSSQRLPRVSVPCDEGGQSGMKGLLDRTEELVAKQVQQMMAGNTEARPRDAHSCDFCPVMQCERRVAR